MLLSCFGKFTCSNMFLKFRSSLQFFFLQLSVFRQNVTPASKNVFEYNINNIRHCSICFVYLKHCRNYLCNLGGVLIDVDDSNDFPKIANQKMSDQQNYCNIMFSSNYRLYYFIMIPKKNTFFNKCEVV